MCAGRVRVDAVLAVACALLLGACATVAPAAVAATTVALGIVLWRRLGTVAWLWALAAVLVGAWRGGQAIGEYEATRAQVRAAVTGPLRCAGRGVVVASPTWVGGATRLTLELDTLDCEGRSPELPVRVRLYGGPDDLRRGDRVEFIGQLAPVRRFANHGLADPRPRAARGGVHLSGSALWVELVERGRGWRAWVDRGRNHARRRIEASFAPSAAPMARALVLGEDDLEEHESLAFKRSGLAHLLAVSGTHLVFAVVALVQALRFVLVRIERLAARYDMSCVAAAAGAVLAPLYADFAGGSGSAWRAAWMLSAAFLSRTVGRKPSASRAVAASLLVAAALDPLAAFDISLLLSAAATSGLLVIGRPWARRCQRIAWRPLRYLVLSVAATSSAMLPCAPLLALLSPTLSVAGVFANVLAMPFGEVVALPLCLGHALTAWLPPLEHGVATVASGALLVVKHIAFGSAALDELALTVPDPSRWHLALLGLGAVGTSLASGAHGLLRPWAARGAWLAALLAGLGWVDGACCRAGHPRGLLRAQLVDVGQGDCALIDLPDGKLMLVDGGGFAVGPVDPGKAVVLPLLRSRRRRRVDIAVLTHSHPDHLVGLSTALASVDVGELWVAPLGKGSDPHALTALIRSMRQRGVTLRGPAELCTGPLELGGAIASVLGPCPRAHPELGPNDNSIVLRLEYGRHSLLLVGDAGAKQEAVLLRQHGQVLRSDLLKVGHHGSGTSSTPDFLDVVRPASAVISSGVRNRFGHPHAATLSRLRARGAQVLRTDQTGSVLWETDGRSARLTTRLRRR